MFKKNIKPKTITLFLEQLSHLLEAGLDIISALELIIKTQSSVLFSHILNKIKLSIKQGGNLSGAINQYPSYFNNLTRQLIYIGEQSGTLDKMLKKSADYQEFQESLKNKIISALFYPCIVLCTAVIVISILLIFVIPQFAHFFEQANANLPLITKIIVDLSIYIKKYILYIIIFIIFLFIILKIFIKKSIIFNYKLNYFILKIPFFGKLIQDKMIIQSTHALSNTCVAGLPLLDSLDLLIPLNQNKVYQLAWKVIKKEIEKGKSLALSMENTGCFSLLCIQLIHSGEHTGKLDIMLNEITRLTTLSLETKLQYFKQSLEPIMMGILGIIIGIIIIALYLPIFKLGTVL